MSAYPGGPPIIPDHFPPQPPDIPTNPGLGPCAKTGDYCNANGDWWAGLVGGLCGELDLWLFPEDLFCAYAYHLPT